MTLTKAALLDLLTAAIAAGGTFDPADTFVGVAQSIANQGQGTTLADVVPATGAMAVRKPVTAWGAPYVSADGNWTVDSNVLLFSPANASEAQIINSFYVADDVAAGALVAFDNVAPPFNAVDETKDLHIVVRLSVSGDAIKSTPVVW